MTTSAFIPLQTKLGERERREWNTSRWKSIGTKGQIVGKCLCHMDEPSS